MPKKYPVGGESRLTREGLRGHQVNGKTVIVAHGHGTKRVTRDVTYLDGSTARVRNSVLLQALLRAKGY